VIAAIARIVESYATIPAIVESYAAVLTGEVVALVVAIGVEAVYTIVAGSIIL
jgi:hypothetical protein